VFIGPYEQKHRAILAKALEGLEGGRELDSKTEVEVIGAGTFIPQQEQVGPTVASWGGESLLPEGKKNRWTVSVGISLREYTVSAEKFPEKVRESLNAVLEFAGLGPLLGGEEQGQQQR